MGDIPVTFVYQGKEYKGHFSKVAGAGSSAMFSLSVDHRHWGYLWFVEGREAFPPPGPAARYPGWRFGSNHHEGLADLAEYFGWIVTAWHDSHFTNSL